MKERLWRIILIFLAFTFVMALSKPIFTIIAGGYSFVDCLSAIWHGLPMDMSVAGYATVFPALLLITSVWADSHKGITTINIIASIYIGIISFIIALAECANAALYPHWHFPLDTTPIFYLTTSIKGALASITLGSLIVGIVSVLILAGIYNWIISSAWRTKAFYFPLKTTKSKVTATAWLLLLTAALFLPIRGGIGVATMNPSRAYFHSDMRMNDAAVNPIFNVLYAAAHQQKFRSEFRFMDDDEAKKIVDGLYCHQTDSMPKLQQTPDVILLILESFSSKLMPSLGGEPIALCLDSIAKEGLLFTDIYSSSFRTDRALPAVLNGYPALPTTSLCKFQDKLAALPALARTLRDNGYETTLYYGGDPNYANMRGLFVTGGISNIVCDKDFPITERLNKWGANDHIVLNRAFKDQLKESEKPRFTTILTLSSHEPFEVPFVSRFENQAANAFAYTDSCVGDYMRRLKDSDKWDNTLIAIVPDHYGAYPELENPIERHQIPFILTGGAISDLKVDSMLLNRTGSQTDIAPTIISLLGINCDEFNFGNSLLDPNRKGFAFFSEPSWIGLKTEKDFAQLSAHNHAQMTEAPDSIYELLKAYSQTLYNDIDAK